MSEPTPSLRSNQELPLATPLARESALSGEVELPTRRAFVLQLNASSAVAAGQFAGSVQHIVSGARQQFRSLPELIAFITRAVVDSDSR